MGLIAFPVFGVDNKQMRPLDYDFLRRYVRIAELKCYFTGFWFIYHKYRTLELVFARNLRCEEHGLCSPFCGM